MFLIMNFMIFLCLVLAQGSIYHLRGHRRGLKLSNTNSLFTSQLRAIHVDAKSNNEGSRYQSFLKTSPRQPGATTFQLPNISSKTSEVASATTTVARAMAQDSSFLYITDFSDLTMTISFSANRRYLASDQEEDQGYLLNILYPFCFQYFTIINPAFYDVNISLEPENHLQTNDGDYVLVNRVRGHVIFLFMNEEPTSPRNEVINTTVIDSHFQEMFSGSTFLNLLQNSNNFFNAAKNVKVVIASPAKQQKGSINESPKVGSKGPGRKEQMIGLTISISCITMLSIMAILHNARARISNTASSPKQLDLRPNKRDNHKIHRGNVLQQLCFDEQSILGSERNSWLSDDDSTTWAGSSSDSNQCSAQSKNTSGIIGNHSPSP